MPAAGRELLEEFASQLASWPWHVAALQEVPPWWPAVLAHPCGAGHCSVLTSRNALLPVRRWVARRNPDLAKSNGGGANTVLCRLPFTAHESARLALRPERRVAQLLRFADGTILANYHGSTRVPLAERELDALGRLVLERAAGGAAVLAGDLNLREPRAPAPLRHLAARDVDHIFAARLERAAEPRLHEPAVLLAGERLALSDHPPLEVALG